MVELSHAELLREYLNQLSLPGAETRLPRWTDWLKMRLGASMALGAALTFVGCDSDSPNQGQGGANEGAAAGATQSDFGGAGTKYGVPLGGTSSSGAGGSNTNPSGGGQSNSGASGSSNIAAGGTTATGGIGGEKYGVPMTGGTTSATSAKTGGMSNVALYAVFMTGGRSEPASGGSAGATNPTAGASSNTGGMSPVAKYAVIMNGGASGAKNSTGGMQANGGMVAALYAVVMMGGTNATSAGSAGAAATGSTATRYGVPMGP